MANIYNTPTRRSILAGAASVPALSLPVIAEPVDPIFTAIERHRVAAATMEAAEPCADEIMNELCGAESDAYAALLSVTPTTKAGAAAALLQVAQRENKSDPWADSWGDKFTAAGHDFLPRRAAVLEA